MRSAAADQHPSQRRRRVDCYLGGWCAHTAWHSSSVCICCTLPTRCMCLCYVYVTLLHCAVCWSRGLSSQPSPPIRYLSSPLSSLPPPAPPRPPPSHSSSPTPPAPPPSAARPLTAVDPVLVSCAPHDPAVSPCRHMWASGVGCSGQVLGALGTRAVHAAAPPRALRRIWRPSRDFWFHLSRPL